MSRVLCFFFAVWVCVLTVFVFCVFVLRVYVFRFLDTVLQRLRFKLRAVFAYSIYIIHVLACFSVPF